MSKDARSLAPLPTIPVTGVSCHTQGAGAGAGGGAGSSAGAGAGANNVA